MSETIKNLVLLLLFSVLSLAAFIFLVGVAFDTIPKTEPKCSSEESCPIR